MGSRSSQGQWPKCHEIAKVPQYLWAVEMDATHVGTFQNTFPASLPDELMIFGHTSYNSAYDQTKALQTAKSQQCQLKKIFDWHLMDHFCTSKRFFDQTVHITLRVLLDMARDRGKNHVHCVQECSMPMIFTFAPLLRKLLFEVRSNIPWWNILMACRWEISPERLNTCRWQRASIGQMQ